MWVYMLVLFGLWCQKSCVVNVTLSDIPHSMPLEYRLVAHFKRYELTGRLRTVPFQYGIILVRYPKILYVDIFL